jgi:AraC family transcriptional regulator
LPARDGKLDRGSFGGGPMDGAYHVANAGRPLRLTRHAAASVLPAHVHDRPRFCMVLRGGFEEVLRGRSSRPGEGMLLYRPAMAEHQEVFGDQGALYGVLEVGDVFLETAARYGFDVEAPAATAHPAGGRLEALLRREIEGWDRFSGLWCEALSLEWLALSMRRLDRLDPPKSDLASRALEYLRSRLDEAPGLGEIAAAVGAHPAHLARAFRRTHGESIGTMCRRLRLERGADLLRAGRAPLVEIAADCGFSSQAHFTTAFRHAFGMTPGAYRRLSG